MIAVKMCGLPNIFEPPKNMTLEVGQTAKFYCTVDMTCMVSYVEWYKQSDNGQSGGNLDFYLTDRVTDSVILLRKGTDPGDPYSYQIQGVDTEDTGLYSCVAGNILGETIHTAYLEVNRTNNPGSARHYLRFYSKL